jgi:uncharacterized protein YeaO (DUF488 family)
MAISVVRLGSGRTRDEGVRVGTVRRPPRGVKKSDYASLDFYDVWLPDLAPSASLLSWAQSRSWTDAEWKTFTRKYRREMNAPAAQRLLALLSALSKTANFSVGCYCEDAARCHRSVLRELLAEAGATIKDATPRAESSVR